MKANKYIATENIVVNANLVFEGSHLYIAKRESGSYMVFDHSGFCIYDYVTEEEITEYKKYLSQENKV